MVLVGRSQQASIGDRHAKFSSQAGAINRFAKRMGSAQFGRFAGQAVEGVQQVSEVPVQVAPMVQDNNFQAADNIAAQAATSVQTSAFRDNQIDAEFEGGKTDQNESLIVNTIGTPIGNIDVAVIAPSQPAPAPAPVEEECTFPVQSIGLTRTVVIANSAPAIQSVDTDRCGNVVQYVEKMTRTMTAGPWVPESGMAGDISSFAVGPGGIADKGVENPQGIFLANSRRPVAPNGATLNVNSAIRVGRARGAGANSNAKQMGASMFHFKSA